KIMKIFSILIILCFWTVYIHCAELCGPRSCAPGLFCCSDDKSAICKPIAQAASLVTFNLTVDGKWTDSAQFIGYIKNVSGRRISKITLNAVGFVLLKPSSIWNAKYTETINEIYIPDFQDGLPAFQTYSFGFISSKLEKPPITIKSVMF
ncbi:hypothetical protein SAMD00019534_033500, partial [Acytostelium subglobosum LB1]|uniref:hypothetical protein n=1 Tax=Acytostelium subglobosum LB1 TaxID=1410327 RepID=UPI000644E708